MADFILVDGELYHFGIKGQKWGVRRFQKKDGSLTSAGKKRYSDETSDAKTDSKSTNTKTKAKSKHRLMLEKKYRDEGLTKVQAEAEADRRIKTERILAAAAGITVAACAAYIIKNKVKDRADQIIKAGTKMQRIEYQDSGKLHDMFYASKGKHDDARYAGLLGFTRQQQRGQAYMLKLENTKDIKVASKDNAAKIFGELYKNDPDFQSAVRPYAAQHFNGGNSVRDTRDVSKRNIKKMYENFNANIMAIRQEGSGADKKFYDKLKSAGYGAIQDINDMKYSGYNAKNPLIIFDNSGGNVLVKNITKMDAGKVEIDGFKEYKKAQGEIKTKKLLEVYGSMTAVGLTSAAVTTYASDYAEDDVK